MIVTRLDGGLGNQMFQYAFGLQLATTAGVDLFLDLSAYVSRPAHGYALDSWQIEAEQVDAAIARRIPRRYRADAPSGKLSRWLDWLDPRALKRVREKPFGFHPKYLSVGDHSYLVGYWQSEDFFPDVREELIAQFQPRRPLSSATMRTIEEMQQGPSVALHVRRGDYVTNSSAAAIYRSLSIDAYYRPCVMEWLAANTGVRAFVFSNDHAWCREHLRLPCPVRYIDHTSGATAFEDMWMMASAQCVIIANSTFSWWGAWLNRRPGRQTIAPRRWFHPGTLDDSRLNCREWICFDDTLSMLRAA